MALITMKDVTIAFEGAVAVDRVSLAVERGDYLVIVGENGSGKSTLMRAMLGLVKPRSGSIVYGDGLVKNGVESTIDTVGRLARFGMKETDEEIIRLMLED